MAPRVEPGRCAGAGALVRHRNQLWERRRRVDSNDEEDREGLAREFVLWHGSVGRHVTERSQAWADLESVQVFRRVAADGCDGVARLDVELTVLHELLEGLRLTTKAGLAKGEGKA